MVVAGYGLPQAGHAPPGNYFKCGETGHWASSCAVRGPKGQMQNVGQSQLWVFQKGVAFDMQGPPPSSCRHCGGGHWEHFCPVVQQKEVGGQMPTRPFQQAQFPMMQH